MVPRIGKYRLVAELARGGMGRVFLAVAQGPGAFHKLVVVKELLPELREDGAHVAMFLDEARLAARLIHQNIVQTNEVGSDGNRQFMVMEYLDGRSLRQLAQRMGDRLPVGAHLQIVAEALAGLHCAHELTNFDGAPLGVVHRDFSPLNVMITFSGQTKVLDFGVAKAASASNRTSVGILKGRIAYMAPEQAAGAPIDRRADLYAAGVMIWEAAARRRLWPGMNDVEVLERLFREGPPPLRSVRRDAPADLEFLAARAMAHRPEDRHPTAADLLRDLEEHLARRQDVLPMRALGSLIAHEFAGERRRMSALVERTLLLLADERSPEGPPSSRSPVTVTLTGSILQDDDPEADVPAPFEASKDPSPATRVLAARSPAVRRTLVSGGSGGVSRSPRWRRGILVGTAAGLLVTAGWSAVRARDLRHEAARAAPRPTAVAGSPASPHPEHFPESIELRVRASPPSARIAVDGVANEANPLRLFHDKDGRAHRVEATADGYLPHAEFVTFSQDVSIDMTLDRRPNPAPTADGSRRPRRPPSARPEASEASAEAPPGARPAEGGPSTFGRPPVRPIATTDPYDDAP